MLRVTESFLTLSLITFLMGAYILKERELAFDDDLINEDELSVL